MITHPQDFMPTLRLSVDRPLDAPLVVILRSTLVKDVR